MSSFEEEIALAWQPANWSDVTVMLAVSGGADSVALLRAMLQIQAAGSGRIVIAHFNHGLRGAESDSDEQFVRLLCDQFDVPCEIGRDECSKATINSESAARQSRYDFLEQAAAQYGARYLATAHTADDQAETVLHRILRGTGVGGLAGIPRVRPLNSAMTASSTTLIRPMLAIRRAQVIEYLAEINQLFREDSTNATCDFTRNQIRNELLPQLADQYNPQVSEALLRLAALAGEAHDILAGLAEELVDQAATIEDPNCVKIDCLALVDQPRYLVREAFLQLWRRQAWPQQAMGFAEWEKLADFAFKHGTQRIMLPGGVLVEQTDGQLMFLRKD